jgi:hypothetical protein
MNLETADLILTQSDTWLSRAIRALEPHNDNKPALVSHTACALGYLWFPPSCMEQLWTLSITPLEKYDNQRIVIYRNKVWTREQKYQIMTNMLSSMNRPDGIYGIGKIGLFALDRLFHTYRFTQKFSIPNFLVCSQRYAYHAYKVIGTDNIFGMGWRSVDPEIQRDYCEEHKEDWDCVINTIAPYSGMQQNISSQ